VKSSINARADQVHVTRLQETLTRGETHIVLPTPKAHFAWTHDAAFDWNSQVDAQREGFNRFLCSFYSKILADARTIYRSARAPDWPRSPVSGGKQLSICVLHPSNKAEEYLVRSFHS
jgi:hypothetical protein